MGVNLEDFQFIDVINTLEYLKRINAYNVTSFFNERYKFNIKIDSNNILDGEFARGSFGKYDVKFLTLGTGISITVGICLRGDRKSIVIKTKTMQHPLDAGYMYSKSDSTEGTARSLQGLHKKFLYFCKQLKIDLSDYKN